MNHFLKLFCVVFLTLLSTKAFSQADTIRLKMVETLTKYIKSNYVSGDVAKQMCDTISWKLANDKYDTALNLDEFAFELTKDLRRVSNDQHITVTQPRYKPFDETDYNSKFDRMTDKQQKKYFEKSKKEWEKFREEYKKLTRDDMFTYGEIKILPGNIGYVEIKDFESTSYDKKKNKGRISIKAVMNFLKNTNSVIIDLRDNQGGYIRQAAKFCSFFSPITNNYFITTERHFRYDSGSVEKELSDATKMNTSDKIDNSFIISKTIYILISHRTFSAAELSTYKIKQYNPSAIVIGEKTQGGGNGHSGVTTEKYFSVVIPYLRTFDENNFNYTFEAIGITPDIVTSADSAFTFAYSLAVMATKSTNKKNKYFKKINAPIAANEQYFHNFYQDYVGDYRKIQIIMEDDKLFIVYDTYDKMQLFSVAKDNFTANHIQLVKFFRDSNGGVIEIQINHSDEFTEKFTRQ